MFSENFNASPHLLHSCLKEHNPLNANPQKWPNTLNKQFIVGLALKGLKNRASAITLTQAGNQFDKERSSPNFTSNIK